MWRSLGLLAAGLAVVTLGVWWTCGGRDRTSGSEVPTITTPSASVSPFATDPAPQAAVTPWPAHVMHDPVVIGPCPITPVAEQDVSSQVEGVLRNIDVQLGQQVREGQVLAHLDDRLLRPQVELLQIKASSDAARLIAKGQFDESEANFNMAKRLSGKSAIPAIEYRNFLYQRERHAEELRKAEEDREVARKELAKAQRTLELYEIKSRIGGEVTRIYRRPGETIKDTEPLVCVTNFNRLRIEGLCKVQQANLVQVGMHALVEPEVRGEQLTELSGHTATITSLAVAGDGRLLASASEDRTVLVWQWPQAARIACLRHPAEVYAVAIAPAIAGNTYVVLTGGADSRARLWNVTVVGAVSGPTVLQDGHESAIRAVAFTADGKRFATGGEDRRIGIWDAATGKRLYWIQPAGAGQEGAHHGAVTSLHFTADGHLVSAGRDNVLKVWKLQDSGAILVAEHQGRTGDVAALGVSPDGRRVLFDHGEEVRILDREQGTSLGSLRGRRQGRFSAVADFSPSGRTVLTVSNNGRIQVWKLPADPEQRRMFRQAYAQGLRRNSGFLAPAWWMNPLPASAFCAESENTLTPQLWELDGYETRYYLPPGPTSVTCGAFSADGSVIFTGGTDRIVRAWAAPPSGPGELPLEAVITYVGSQVERGTDTVRIRAELDNPRDPSRRLRAGTYASLRIYPETAVDR